VASSRRLFLFAVTPPGLEDLTRAELFALGVNHPRAVPGGVEFEGFLSHLYKINLCRAQPAGCWCGSANFKLLPSTNLPVSPLPTPNTPAMFNDQKMIQAA